MQRAHRRLPRLEAYSADVFARALGRRQRHRAAVARQHEPFIHPTGHQCLHALHGAVDEPRRAAAGRLLAEHVPGLQRMAQFQRDTAQRDLADAREAEFEMRREPGAIETEPVRAKLLQHVGEILRDVMRQQEVVVDAGAPVHQTPLVGRPPERRHGGAHQQELRRRHPRMRRHFQRTEFDQPQPARCGLRCVQLVDAELGAMRVAGHVGQQMAEHPIDQPGRHLLAGL